MAGWGKINDDRLYGLITFDLDRAFALAGLREYEAIIVQVMREHSWGPARRKAKGEPWPDATPYSLPLNALATALGVPLPRLSEAKARLLASNILIPAEGGYLINKEADQWTDPATGAPRLTDAKVAYALSAPKRRKKVTPIRNQEVTPIRNLEVEEVTPIRNQGLRETVSQVTPIRNLSTKEDRAHDLEIREFKEEIKDTHRVSVSTKPKVEIPEYTEDQIREVADRVEQLGGMDFWGSKVRGFSKNYPLEWIEAAAENAAAKGKDWSYVHGMLQKWYAAGKPNLPLRDAAPSANGAPATKPHDRRREELQQGVAARVAKSNPRGNQP